MPDHLTQEQLESYLLLRMPVRDLLAADDHLSACAECRARVAARTPLSVTLEIEHPPYEELVEYLDGTADEGEREAMESHLSGCTHCSAELADLRAARAEISATTLEPAVRAERIPLWRKPIIWTPVYTAALAVVALVLVRDANQKTDRLATEVAALKERSARVQDLEKQAAALRAANDDLRRQLSHEPEIVAFVMDHGHRIALTDGGALKTDLMLPPDMSASVVAALSGRPLPNTVGDLRGRAGVLMGPAQEGVPFSLVAPVGTRVRDARPVFQWKPVSGGSGYVVEVYDENFHLLAKSESVAKSRWRPAVPLPPARTYVWQVTASMKDGSSVTSPGPSAPEAKFRALSAKALKDLNSAAAGASGSHLALGLLYTRHGLLDEATGEFRALLKENPSSSQAKRLLSAVQRRSDQ